MLLLAGSPQAASGWRGVCKPNFGKSRCKASLLPIKSLNKKTTMVPLMYFKEIPFKITTPLPFFNGFFIKDGVLKGGGKKRHIQLGVFVWPCALMPLFTRECKHNKRKACRVAQIEGFVAGGMPDPQWLRWLKFAGIYVKTEDFVNFHIPEFWDLQAVLAYFPWFWTTFLSGVRHSKQLVYGDIGIFSYIHTMYIYI